MFNMLNSDTPEIKDLREKWPSLTYEEKIDAFLWKMVWFHHQKHIPGNPNQAINDLADTIKKASSSSEELTRSIGAATWVAAIVGGVGLILAFLNLLHDLGKI
jgi:hypothetical protein